MRTKYALGLIAMLFFYQYIAPAEMRGFLTFAVVGAIFVNQLITNDNNNK